MSYGEVLALPNEDFLQLWQAISVIEAQDTLRMFTVSAFPHCTKDSRSKLHREMHTIAYPSSLKDEVDNEKAVTTREYALMMRGLRPNGR